MQPPDVSYARSGDVAIAYQVVGEGPTDLVFVGLGSDGKIAGIAVSIGARIASLAAHGEVLVSSTVKDLVARSGLQFEDRGEHQLEGIADVWRLFAVAP